MTTESIGFVSRKRGFGRTVLVGPAASASFLQPFLLLLLFPFVLPFPFSSSTPLPSSSSSSS